MGRGFESLRAHFCFTYVKLFAGDCERVNRDMVAIAQLVERQIVVLDVKGSSPSIHPILIVSVHFSQMLNIQRELQHLKTIRDAILPKLMNGEIDVSNIRL